MSHGINETVRVGLDALSDVIADVKPKLRGWLHLATAPLTLAAGIVLIALSPNATTRIGSRRGGSLRQWRIGNAACARCSTRRTRHGCCGGCRWIGSLSTSG